MPSTTTIGTPHSPTATRVLFCGAGELGKEIVIELKRLGCEVIAVDGLEAARPAGAMSRPSGRVLEVAVDRCS